MKPRPTVAPALRPPGARLREAWHGLISAGFSSPLYRLTLGGPAPDRLLVTPEDPWPGDPAEGDAVFQGRYRFAGREAVAPNQPPWRLRPDDEPWLTCLHGFDWLRHFAAADGPAAQAHARRLVRSWIEQCGDWDALTWAPEVTACRLVAWLGHAGFLLDGAEAGFRMAFLDSLARQLRHLARAAAHAPPGAPRIAAAVGLATAGLCLPDEGGRAARGLELLARELDWQVLPDGGHASRSPSQQLAVLRHLVGLREAMRAAGRAVPGSVQAAIDRMAPLLRAFRHGDGALAVFNGGAEETAEAVETVLARAEVRGRPLDNALHSGFQRLQADKTLVLIDAGAPPAPPLDRAAHAGCLSLELSAGRQRLVVNCGSGSRRDPEWTRAARQTAAHSTLVLNDDGSCALGADGGFERRPEQVLVHREQDEAGNTWLEASHDGYLAPYGVLHRRRLYLDGAGLDLRGEDTLSGDRVAEAAGRAFHLRFHLHPEVQASLVQGGTQVLLKPARGPGWRFRADGGRVGLEESVYLGGGAGVRRTEQIVVQGRVDGRGARVRWAFRQA